MAGNLGGVIGEINTASDERDTFEWFIPDISSVRESGKDHSFASPGFDCLGSRWCLEIYPNDKGSERILLRIRRFKPHPSNNMRAQVGLKIQGLTFQLVNRVAIPGDSDDSPKVKFLKWSDLQRERFQPMDLNALTIMCKIMEVAGFSIHTSPVTRTNIMPRNFEGVIGEINAAFDETDTVEWYIPHISSVRESRKDHFYASPDFDCMGSRWRLEIYPNDVGSERILLRIRRFEPHPSNDSTAEVGIRNRELAFQFVNLAEIPGNSDDSPKVIFLKWSDLESQIMSSDDLTIMCTMTMVAGEILQKTCFSRKCGTPTSN